MCHHLKPPKFPPDLMPHNTNLPPPSSLNPIRGNLPLFSPQPFPYPPLGFQYPYPVPPFYFTIMRGSNDQPKDPDSDDPKIIQDLDDDHKSKENLETLEE